MYEALVEVKPKVRMWIMVKVIPKEPGWETSINNSLSKRTADPPMAPAVWSRGAIIAVGTVLCN